MPVNRVWFVFEEDTEEDSLILDSKNKVSLKLEKGKIYFIPCDYTIGLKLEPGSSFVSWQFNLDLFYGFDAFESHTQCESLANPELVEKARKLMEHEEELQSLCQINEIIFHLCSLWSQTGEVDIWKNLTKQHNFGQVLEYIQKSGDASTTVEALADINGMRKDVFSRKFSKDMGMSPKDFISDVLVRKASEMLLAPDTLVKQVAENLNFSSEYYFSHFFKRQTGISPKAYQKQNGFK